MSARRDDFTIQNVIFILNKLLYFVYTKEKPYFHELYFVKLRNLHNSQIVKIC